MRRFKFGEYNDGSGVTAEEVGITDEGNGRGIYQLSRAEISTFREFRLADEDKTLKIQTCSSSVSIALDVNTEMCCGTHRMADSNYEQLIDGDGNSHRALLPGLQYVRWRADEVLN